MGFKYISKSLTWHLEFYGFQPDKTKVRVQKSERYWRQGSEEIRFIWDSATRICKLERKLSEQDQWLPLSEVSVKRIGWRWLSRMDWSNVETKLFQPLNEYLNANRVDRPFFPLTVRWLPEDEEEEGEHEIFDSIASIACNLEWFDSKELESEATVHDRMGRPVRLLVKALDVVRCELE